MVAASAAAAVIPRSGSRIATAARANFRNWLGLPLAARTRTSIPSCSYGIFASSSGLVRDTASSASDSGSSSRTLNWLVIVVAMPDIRRDACISELVDFVPPAMTSQTGRSISSRWIARSFTPAWSCSDAASILSISSRIGSFSWPAIRPSSSAKSFSVVPSLSCAVVSFSCLPTNSSGTTPPPSRASHPHRVLRPLSVRSRTDLLRLRTWRLPNLSRRSSSFCRNAVVRWCSSGMFSDAVTLMVVQPWSSARSSTRFSSVVLPMPGAP